MSSPIYGLMAEFENPEQLVKATERAYEAGYRKMDAYTPFPVEGAAEAMHFHNTGVPPIVLVGGLVGAFSGFLIQVIGSAYDYPLNVGGRPLYSWPAFIPVTFEAGILIAAFAAVIAMIVLNGLPRPYHPVFNAPNFERVSEDRFFLCIEAKDPKFEQASTRAFLESLGPQQVSEVER
jgi:hypothetical protein